MTDMTTQQQIQSDISVIVINYNTFDMTCNCIASIKEKTKGRSVEIILVDNASTECDATKFVELFPDIEPEFANLDIHGLGRRTRSAARDT